MFEISDQIRQEFVRVCQSLFDRGYATGGAGNVSQLLSNDLVLSTPTGSSLGRLDPKTLSVIDLNGRHIAGDKPSKEASFHLAIYNNKPQCKAIVHLHSTALTAVSCLQDIDPSNALKACTPYYVMRIGKLPVVPYFKPGDPKLAEELSNLAPTHRAFLLANHGPVVCGSDLWDAADNAEELEETAKLQLLLAGQTVRYLTPDEVHTLSSMGK
ncbi:aldolase [Photobacterium gaetbulicola]|uniref:3-oxo-tetronate 4-phosphate decarboxylase n=1 Tax=Photobacterium gaetbulicola TaxID=1295392 RepID=A0A0B9GYV6_9GAMM|nr:aldolase [Photobacterium gaetbulicola]KHT61832.1 aldolase [Photobacterium gaetbulicola]